MVRGGAALSLLILLACGDESDPVSPPPDEPPGCEPEELALLDGSCVSVGVPADRCAPGFQPDGDGGCVALLPEQCPVGTMATPGDETCREVAPCSGGRWGDAPLTGEVLFVDAAALPDGDGSEDAPFRRIQTAAAAASSGATIAIAAGHYLGPVQILSKTLKLWGSCPAEVEIHSSSDAPGVVVLEGAHGSELHNLAVRAADGLALGVSGSTEVLLDRVWVHQTGYLGVVITDQLGPASATIVDSLIEDAALVGLYLQGSSAQIERTVVRQVVIHQGQGGSAVLLQPGSDSGAPSNASLRQSVVGDADHNGVGAYGSHMVVEQSVVRRTHARLSSASSFGTAIGADGQANMQASVVIRSSVLEQALGNGVFVAGADMLIEDTVIRDIRPADGWDRFGRCVSILDAGQPGGEVVIRSSLLERCTEVALMAAGSAARAESLLIRDVLPGFQLMARGVLTRPGVAPSRTTSLWLRWSRIERANELGIQVGCGSAQIEGVHVRDTLPRPDGLMGDGIAVLALEAQPHLLLTDSQIDRSERAGLGNFGGHVEMASSVLWCSGIDLVSQSFSGEPIFTDLGANRCGCETPSPCQALPAGLEPPGALP